MPTNNTYSAPIYMQSLYMGGNDTLIESVSGADVLNCPPVRVIPVFRELARVRLQTAVRSRAAVECGS